MRKVLFLFFSFLLAGGMSFAQIIVTGDITSNTTWTSNNTYLLRDLVRVQSGATLTIEPGTIIYGENSTLGSLIIKPGGKIMAEGTVNNPIVFTSEFNKPGSLQEPTYGDWGGIILLGNAPINVPGGVASIEGPGDQYGGTDPEDNSGVMKYVRIEYPGVAYSLNNEINGLTFGGVGRGTTIDYIQVSYSGDDSYEWFGGTVNCKHLIAYRGWDDEFDTDFGFSGKLQFLVGLRDPEVADQSGSNGFESDNDGSGSTNSPRTSPTWWNVTLVGPLATTTTPINSLFKRGMHLRRSSQNKINNTLDMGWPLGILIDGVNTTTDAQNGVMYVKNSIVSGNTGAVIDSVSSNGTFNPSLFFSSNNNRSFPTNAEVLLRNPFNLENPNFLPKPGSPVLTGGGTPPNDGFFDPTATFVGAFGSEDWTAGWAKFMVSDKQQVVVTGDITSNTTWTSNNTYLLRDLVRVQSGATLTIEPGTIIYGENSTLGSLIIKPGGKIMAEGTVNNPIVFTSEFNKPGSLQEPTYGDWGGIILLGNAPINVPGGVASIEGPGDQYGGTDPEDNSGVMKYVRIEYPGVAYSLNNEINGLTFGGVGRGTTIDYIQVSYSGDDSYEWFGGTVNCKHLIAYRGWDDEFDTDFGFQGKLQFLVGLRDPEVADQSGSNGFESDNDGSGSTNSPRTSPTWWNVTLVGPLATTTTPINSLFKRGMHLRRSSQNKINNTLDMGWPLGILIDGVNTTTDAQNGVMYVKNSIVSGNTGAVIDSVSSNGTFNPSLFFSSNNNRSFVTNAEVSLVAPFDLNNPNFLPLGGSPTLTGAGTPPNDGFFDPTATFVGAFGSEDWTFGWARFKPEVTTDVEEIKISGTTPTNYNLSQNYPNPFNPSTKISYSVIEPTNVKLTVYNILGQQVALLVNDFKSTGTYQVNFDASSLSSGIYIYSLEAGNIVVSKKMTLLK
ncbi:MAG: T9SS type A sorting domain-containing protein [Ignavibacteriales bacterium]|nr:T9SS type A sorting domain-containing protein [Ignavibacteriales bacterium]